MEVLTENNYVELSQNEGSYQFEKQQKAMILVPYRFLHPEAQKAM